MVEEPSFGILIHIFTFQGRTFQLEKNVMCGRLVCDVKISAKELIRSRSYDMGALCQNVSIHIQNCCHKPSRGKISFELSVKERTL